MISGGKVLDVAAGSGRNARWLAQQGYQVEAVDINAAALSSMHGVANIQTRQADLETGPWPYSKQQFDAIVVCRYLHRPLLKLLPASLKPGGILVYETFMQGQQAYGRPHNADFLLNDEELLHVYAAQLSVLAFEQGSFSSSPGGPVAMLQRLCARAPQP